MWRGDNPESQKSRKIKPEISDFPDIFASGGGGQPGKLEIKKFQLSTLPPTFQIFLHPGNPESWKYINPDISTFQISVLLPLTFHIFCAQGNLASLKSGKVEFSDFPEFFAPQGWGW